MSGKGGLRAIAILEATKGLIVLAAGIGALDFIGRNTERAAEEIVSQFHLNPAHAIPRIFIAIAQNATPTHLWMLAGGAAAYAVVRFVEAYGLWREKLWAEWFAVISGAMYVPWELWELGRGVTWIRAGLLAVNLTVVGYLVWALKRSKAEAARRAGAPSVRRAPTTP